MSEDDMELNVILKIHYPIAAASISPLEQLAKTNLHLIDKILELAMMIGINAAFERIETDKKNSVKELIRENMLREPRW